MDSFNNEKIEIKTIKFGNNQFNFITNKISGLNSGYFIYNNVKIFLETKEELCFMEEQIKNIYDIYKKNQDMQLAGRLIEPLIESSFAKDAIQKSSDVRLAMTSYLNPNHKNIDFFFTDKKTLNEMREMGKKLSNMPTKTRSNFKLTNKRYIKLNGIIKNTPKELTVQSKIGKTAIKKLSSTKYKGMVLLSNNCAEGILNFAYKDGIQSVKLCKEGINKLIAACRSGGCIFQATKSSLRIIITDLNVILFIISAGFVIHENVSLYMRGEQNLLMTSFKIIAFPIIDLFKLLHLGYKGIEFIYNTPGFLDIMIGFGFLRVMPRYGSWKLIQGVRTFDSHVQGNWNLREILSTGLDFLREWNNKLKHNDTIIERICKKYPNETFYLHSACFGRDARQFVINNFRKEKQIFQNELKNKLINEIHKELKHEHLDFFNSVKKSINDFKNDLREDHIDIIKKDILENINSQKREAEKEFFNKKVKELQKLKNTNKKQYIQELKELQKTNQKEYLEKLNEEATTESWRLGRSLYNSFGSAAISRSMNIGQRIYRDWKTIKRAIHSELTEEEKKEFFQKTRNEFIDDSVYVTLDTAKNHASKAIEKSGAFNWKAADNKFEKFTNKVTGKSLFETVTKAEVDFANNQNYANLESVVREQTGDIEMYYSMKEIDQKTFVKGLENKVERVNKYSNIKNKLSGAGQAVVLSAAFSTAIKIWEKRKLEEGDKKKLWSLGDVKDISYDSAKGGISALAISIISKSGDGVLKGASISAGVGGAITACEQIYKCWKTRDKKDTDKEKTLKNEAVYETGKSLISGFLSSCAIGALGISTMGPALVVGVGVGITSGLVLGLADDSFSKSWGKGWEEYKYCCKELNLDPDEEFTKDDLTRMIRRKSAEYYPSSIDPKKNKEEEEVFKEKTRKFSQYLIIICNYRGFEDKVEDKKLVEGKSTTLEIMREVEKDYNKKLWHNQSISGIEKFFNNEQLKILYIGEIKLENKNYKCKMEEFEQEIETEKNKIIFSFTTEKEKSVKDASLLNGNIKTFNDENFGRPLRFLYHSEEESLVQKDYLSSIKLGSNSYLNLLTNENYQIYCDKEKNRKYTIFN